MFIGILDFPCFLQELYRFIFYHCIRAHLRKEICLLRKIKFHLKHDFSEDTQPFQTNNHLIVS
jgi:hypothetical protein